MNDPSEPFPPGKLEISKLVLLNKREAKDAPSENLPCWITFFDPEKDPWVRKTYGMKGLRRHKLLRITGEVYEQSISLNQEVVSSDLLGCGIRTLQRDIILFASLGVWIPFQHVSNPNRAGRYTYKVAVVKLYLEGMTKAEITSSLYHDPERIGKFIADFARFTKLAQSGLSIYQIKAVLLLPEALLEEYWTLFKIYNTPQLFKKLDLLAKAVR